MTGRVRLVVLLASALLASSTAHADAVDELSLAVGENKMLPGDSVREYAIGAPDVLAVAASSSGKELVLSGKKAGQSSLLLIRPTGASHRVWVHVYPKLPEVVARELSDLVGMRLEANVADLTAPVASALPGRSTSKLVTNVHLKVGQSLVLSGIRTRHCCSACASRTADTAPQRRTRTTLRAPITRMRAST